MPIPVLDNLTSESSTRDLLNALLAYHHARGPALAVARMALESAADALAKGTGVAERVVLTDPERDISPSGPSSGAWIALKRDASWTSCSST